MELKLNNVTFTVINTMSVYTETNGLQGGDSGHGGYVTVRIGSDTGFDEIRCEKTHERVDAVNITVSGDSEMRTLACAMKSIGDALMEDLGISQQEYEGYMKTFDINELR